MRKFITSILILLSVAVVVTFIIFVVNIGSNNMASQRQQITVIKAKDLSVLKISAVGKSVSGGVTSDNYAFKTKGNNVIELGIKGHSSVSSKQGIINSLIKIAKASDDVSSPYFKADKWDGESNFSLTFNDAGNFNVILNNGTAISEDSNYKFEFAPVDIKQGFNDEGGLDVSITLKKAPPGNQLSFSYDSQSARAFLQPSLTKEWTVGQDLDDGKTVGTVTDTDVYDNKGNPIAHRPDYVVNAIAFYGNPNQVNDMVGGKQYKTGEIGMLYRMKVTDANNNTTWADWSIPNGTTLWLTIPSAFLASAVYPIVLSPAGDTFGYTTLGSTLSNGPCRNTVIVAGPQTFLGEAATGVSISIGGAIPSGTAHVQGAVYDTSSPNNLIVNSNTPAITINSSVAQWWTGTYITQPTFTAINYFICHIGDTTWSISGQLAYNFITGGFNTKGAGGEIYGIWPSTITLSTFFASQIQPSIYVTYTPPTVNFSGGINLSGGICVGDAACPWACGNNVNFTYKGSQATYGTVSHNGMCWMNRNLGASRVATAYNDSNAYGDLFQWGRLDDGHQTRTSGTTTNLSGSDNPGHSNFIYGMGSPYDWRSPQGSGCGGNSCLWQGVSGVNNPCPSGWRIPTQAEWTTEYGSWSSQDYNGAFASPLKLTAGGYRSYIDASLLDVGSFGYYWSSTVNGTLADYLTFGSGNALMNSYGRANSYSVRCVKN